jgi:hypothetical protein
MLRAGGGKVEHPVHGDPVRGLAAWGIKPGTGGFFPVPYTVVLVEPGGRPVRLVGYLPGRPEREAGMAMRVWFEPVGDDGARLPQWMPAAEPE